MKNRTSIQFVNHASVLVRHGEIGLLSDPWYQGDAFHKGWNLIHELNDSQIHAVLDRVTHIWISHEHPDHFSILFFKKFGKELKEKNIQIIFQETKDKRVENFLLKSGHNVHIVLFNSWLKLSNEFEILCFKDGFYDSGLAIKTADKSILNLNDCEIKNSARCKEVSKITGHCDVLLTQFSYAAWKGGVDNIAWRRLAATEKLDTMMLQASHFKPKVIIPFASYIYFSNDANFYINDAANKPRDVIDAFKLSDFAVKVMEPFEILDSLDSSFDNSDSLKFWNQKLQLIDQNNLNTYARSSLDDLEVCFQRYKERVFKNNSKWFMWFAKYFSPVAAFRPVTIHLTDLKQTIRLDLFSKALNRSTLPPDISMYSESLKFIFSNTFGFDTLTVNGCFEEKRNGGFSRMTKTLAIENLNNMGIEFRPKIIFNYQLISMFISRLLTISKKLKLSMGNS
jgi:hypothetical protein